MKAIILLFLYTQNILARYNIIKRCRKWPRHAHFNSSLPVCIQKPFLKIIFATLELPRPSEIICDSLAAYSCLYEWILRTIYMYIVIYIYKKRSKLLLHSFHTNMVTLLALLANSVQGTGWWTAALYHMHQSLKV